MAVHRLFYLMELEVERLCMSGATATDILVPFEILRFLDLAFAK